MKLNNKKKISLWLDKKQRTKVNITQITPTDIVTNLCVIVDENLRFNG